MKKHIVTLTAIAVLSVGAATTASASSSYTVQSGDTLWGISQDKNVSVESLKGWNNLSSDLILPSQELEIDGQAATPKTDSSTYTVKSGDTLFEIASAHGISLDSLTSWNGISGYMIYPGDTLTVKGGTAVAEKAPAKTASAPAKSTAPAPTPASAPAEKAPTQASTQAGKTMTVSATAYTAYCAGCSGTTATGIDLRANPNQKVIAVDPSVIPLGSKVWVEGYGEAIAGDTGGAIKGNKIDVFIPTQGEALNWGRKNITIKVLN
ncbi:MULTISPECIES: 3D domain-containing protein [Planococcus]|uniref:Peptidoglycan-binding protein n=2 Tax=Planococcus TaxID=1372 RepID=A0ABN4JYF8_9BACL|nr:MULTISPECIES: 3D domain-containing protein [Planococcus]ALS79860.1 peptidoglycan-binding protein [Planococcus kocurii]AQU78152.1 peptidoglycan-binding protein [Planococcus faecalis]KAA0957270.1 LysM peptidoglycan-binding domain-containing protein [Planococcus sp. ANT_H30]MDJ0331215.1 LysM peptidoglycan-binding domain-containing protein [Planococcus sp. S3-L1]